MTITEKIDAVTGIPEESLLDAPPPPRSCKIELTARCNLNCAFCATGYKMRDKRDMDWDFYSKKLLPDLRANGIEEVGMFYLGESFLLPWLPDAIAEAKRQGFPYVFLTTNGTVSTPKKMEDCMRAGLDSLKFSMNYADEDQFVEIARAKPSFFRNIIDNIKAAAEIRDREKFDCGIYASYIQYDGEQNDKMMEVVEEVRPYVDEVYALPLYSQADITGAENKERGWKIWGGNPGRLENPRPPVPCWSLFGEARVSHDGHMSACCFDHDGRFDAGNLNEMSFMDAWHSDFFKELRKAHLDGDVRATVCGECVSYAEI